MFASGWLLVWQIAQLAGCLVLVVPCFLGQAAESIKPPMNTPSLGTFGIIMMISTYFAGASFVNTALIGRALGWHAAPTILASLAVAAALAFGTGWMMHVLATRGGVTLVALVAATLLALLIVNVGGPRWARDRATTDTPTASPA